MSMDQSRIRKEKVADSKISGYVWTGNVKGAMTMGFFSDPVNTTPEKFSFKTEVSL